jgi:hypothetical protein
MEGTPALLSTISALTLKLVTRAEQWFGRVLNADRVLAIVGLLATVLSTVIGIVLTVGSRYVGRLALASTLLMLVTVLVMAILLRSSRSALAALPPYPYRVRSKLIAVDIRTQSGSEATVEFKEDIQSLQDGLAMMRKSFWGDWDPLTAHDLACEEPASAVVADHFREAFAAVFLLSLRRIYNYKDTFQLRTRLTVRNGFRKSHSEYYSYTASARVDSLRISIVLPKDKQFVSNSLFARTGNVGFYNYTQRQIQPANLSVTDDGRQQAWHEWRAVREGRTYTICWDWNPDGVSTASAGQEPSVTTIVDR